MANVVCDFSPADGSSYQVTILSDMEPFKLMELNQAVDPMAVYLPLDDRFSLESGDTGRVSWLSSKTGMAVSFTADNQFHLLSLWPDGGASHSKHSAQSSSVTLGSCQVA